jgi:SnoaL-like domain
MQTDSYTLTFADVLSIDDTIARYNRGMDGPDREVFLSAFTDDAVWASPSVGAFEGLDALGDWFDSRYPKDASHRRRQHRVTNRRYTATSETRLEMWSNFIVLALAEEGPQVIDMGNYTDVLIRDADRGWLIGSRSIDRGNIAA